MATCKARCTTYDSRLYFADGKHRFFMELRCGEPSEGPMCTRCSQKKKTPLHYNKSYDHGLVDGPYLEGSQLYDTPYYHWAVEKFGPPNPIDVQKAMEAQRIARGGAKVVESEVVKPTKVAKPKVVRAKAPKEEPVEKPKKETKKTGPKPKTAAKKEVAPAIVAPVEEAKPLVKLPEAPMESMDDPLPVIEVIKVVLKPFTVGQTTYWRDGEREKLYKKEGGKKGPYVGRWDHFTQSIIRDAPDSDSD